MSDPLPSVALTRPAASLACRGRELARETNWLHAMRLVSAVLPYYVYLRVGGRGPGQRYLHLTTVARAPFWWAANSGMMRIRTGSSSRSDSIDGRFTQFVPSEN